MKLGIAILPLLMLVGAFTNVYAAQEEQIEVKSKDKDGKSEFKMKVHRQGDSYVGVSDGHEYVLRGDSVSTIRDDGDYYVTGRRLDDRTFETTEVRPVTRHEYNVSTERPVEERHVIEQRPVEERRVIEERPVQREIIREEKKPLFKAGPLEIK